MVSWSTVHLQPMWIHDRWKRSQDSKKFYNIRTKITDVIFRISSISLIPKKIVGTVPTVRYGTLKTFDFKEIIKPFPSVVGTNWTVFNLTLFHLGELELKWESCGMVCPYKCVWFLLQRLPHPTTHIIIVKTQEEDTGITKSSKFGDTQLTVTGQGDCWLCVILIL